MKEIFYEILNLSLSAAYLVPVVLVLRLVLKKAPRWTMCLLWGLVALRLVMPFSMESDVSLHPGRQPVTELQNQFAGETARPETPPVEMPPAELPEAPSVTPAPAPAEELDLMEILGWVWLAGACTMALYGAVSYVRLKLKVRPSLQVEKRVFVCDGIGYPFLLGVLRPKVYLPSDLEEPHLSYVLAHEKAHVKRGDHLWKPLGFALLTIHWFNPLLWVAYLLLCRDIESACDEKVVRDMDNTQKDGYSRALLACSLQGAFHRGWISACPVAFGETGVKTRIKSVLHYKKPAFWVLLIAILACIAVGVFFLTDPAEEPDVESSTESSEESAEESLEESTTSESDTIILPVLVGDRVGMYNEYCLTKKAEVSDKATTWRDEARAGDTLELSLPGVEAPLKFKYYSTAQNLRFPNEEITYIASGFGQMLIINAQTSELIGITFLEHPQGLTLKDKKITLGQARNECSVFVGEYFPDIDMSEWVLQVELDHSDEAMAEFIFMYYRYLDGIEVGQLIFKFDACGNLKMFSQDHYQSEVLPQYTDKEYLASAQARIFEHYYAFDDVAEVKDLRLSKKEKAYIPSAECNAIKYTVSYTVVLQDGTELNTANEFFLPYDETGKAISVELETMTDK